MGSAVPLRSDYDGETVRRVARAPDDANQTRRLLALAIIYDGGKRSDAAALGGVGLQMVRDLVLRFNTSGPAGLIAMVKGIDSLSATERSIPPMKFRAAKNNSGHADMPTKGHSACRQKTEELNNEFLSALDEINFEILKNFSAVREFFIEHLKSEAMVRENNKVIIQLIKEGQNAKLTAYLFLRVILEDLLLDGDCHISKGKLNQRGAYFLKLYNIVISKLLKFNWFSEAQAQDKIKEITEGVEAMHPIWSP